MNNINFRIKSHKEISNLELNQIIALKDEHWSYGVESQKKWIESNLEPDDIHFMCFYGEILVAYLNMIHIKIQVNDSSYKMLGIGNVCVEKNFEHSGWGKKLLLETNRFILDHHFKGILLCKENLIAFYKKCGWIKIENSNIMLINEKYHNYLMSFPVETKDIIFHSHNNIFIEKNF